MNTLRALRESLVTDLSATGVAVLTYLPERITPPLAIVAAGSPYLEGGSTFGSYRVRFTLVLVCAQGTNDTTTNALDESVTATVVALDGGGWDIERVDQPTMLQANNTEYLSTTIDVARPTSIQDEEEG